MALQALETEQKALEINLDDNIYGTFAEIGAGQEVARYFFQVGAAAGTIAKTISAYDKVYSDKIYGLEASGRYVCESRLYKMLDHEYDLMIERLENQRPNANFFVFADTIAAINYTKTIKGDGWLGLRFQLSPNGLPNEIVLHVKMLDNDNHLQQQAIGVLGVNLIYGCYKYHEDPEMLIQSLMDGLHGRVAIDMLRLSGPNFEEVDNRWLCLMLVKNGLSDVAMFGPDGRSIHASEFLYRKNVLVVRGSFRPPTLVNIDMIRSSRNQFFQEAETDPNKAFVLTEITMDNLKSDGELDEKDFMDRADLLCTLNQTVVISNCEEHHKLVRYLADYKPANLGLVLGVRELLEMISTKYFENRDGRLLASFGELFTRKVKMYIYPTMQEGSEELMNAKNLPIPEGIKFLYKHLLDSKHILDIEGFQRENLHIFSREVLRMIKNDEDGWEQMVPPRVAKMIKDKCLFDFPYKQKEFEY